MPLNTWRWRRLVKRAGAIVGVGLVAGALFVWSGVYNVAASSDHWAVTTWLLERVRVYSVRTWSSFVDKPPPLDDAGLVALGAGHFEGGCVPCHGRPGEPVNAIVDAMLPPPPPLDEVLAGKEAKEIFWIVKHGLKYTAMPAWPAQEREDEVWALTAFLLQLPDLAPSRYRELSGAARVARNPPAAEDLAESSEAVALTQCVRCHGDGTTTPLSDLVPRLDGQPEAYLTRALAEYAQGQRPSGIMEPVADILDADELRRVAAYYAALEPHAAEPLRTDVELELERGSELAIRGDPRSAVPPCLACHSAQHPRMFPSLAGQSRAYLASQLRVFKRGVRDRTAYGEIMTIVARRLTEEQIEHAAAYFSSLPVAGAPPLSAVAAR